MATDGPDPTPCDKEVFDHGACIFVTNTIPSNAMEGWVKKVAKLSSQRVDWHFAGGYARVLAIGDLAAVEAAVRELLPEHDALYAAAVKKVWSGFPTSDEHVSDLLRWFPNAGVTR